MGLQNARHVPRRGSPRRGACTQAHYHFLESHPPWEQNTLAAVVAKLKTAFDYPGKTAKRIKSNPLADVKTPPKITRVEIFIPEQVEPILAAASPLFREFCWFLYHTGRGATVSTVAGRS